MLGQNDALGLADRVLAEHRHPAAQQLARAGVAGEPQGVCRHPFGLGPGRRGLGIQLAPHGVDQGVRQALLQAPARREGGDEPVRHLGIDGGVSK